MLKNKNSLEKCVNQSACSPYLTDPSHWLDHAPFLSYQLSICKQSSGQCRRSWQIWPFHQQFSHFSPCNPLYFMLKTSSPTIRKRRSLLWAWTASFLLDKWEKLKIGLYTFQVLIIDRLCVYHACFHYSSLRFRTNEESEKAFCVSPFLFPSALNELQSKKMTSLQPQCNFDGWFVCLMLVELLMHHFISDMVDEPAEIEGWMRQQVLGCGAFGVVTLWKNRETGKKIGEN